MDSLVVQKLFCYFFAIFVNISFEFAVFCKGTREHSFNMDIQYERIQVSEKEFASTAVKWITEKITDAIKQRGVCVIGLSGGSTPGPIYEALGKEAAIDFSKVYIFAVDERYISKDDKDSNHNLVTRTLLSNAKVPQHQIIFPHTTLPLDECIKDYEKRLKEVFDKHGIDIVTLGVGPDGHIASLFPPVLKEAFEPKNIVLHTTTKQFAVFDRISTTIPVLKSAKRQVFFLKGKDKVEMWDGMISEWFKPERWPAHEILATKKSALIAAL